MAPSQSPMSLRVDAESIWRRGVQSVLGDRAVAQAITWQGTHLHIGLIDGTWMATNDASLSVRAKQRPPWPMVYFKPSRLLPRDSRLQDGSMFLKAHSIPPWIVPSISMRLVHLESTSQRRKRCWERKESCNGCGSRGTRLRHLSSIGRRLGATSSTSVRNFARRQDCRNAIAQSSRC